MTMGDVTDYRSLLLDRLESLVQEDQAGADARKTVTLDQQSVGRLSRMDALQQQAMANATHARRGVERSAILSALKRLDDGEFGFCADCGDDIPEPRLQLNPTVLKCIGCARG